MLSIGARSNLVFGTYSVLQVCFVPCDYRSERLKADKYGCSTLLWPAFHIASFGTLNLGTFRVGMRPLVLDNGIY